MSKRRLVGVGELTAERLAELRRIAEAATPGPWVVDALNQGVVGSVETPDGYVIAQTQQLPGDTGGVRRRANTDYIATFDPPTVLAMLGEIERLRRERDALAAAVRDARNAMMHGEWEDAARAIDEWFALLQSDEEGGDRHD